MRRLVVVVLQLDQAKAPFTPAPQRPLLTQHTAKSRPRSIAGLGATFKLGPQLGNCRVVVRPVMMVSRAPRARLPFPVHASKLPSPAPAPASATRSASATPAQAQ